MGTTDPLRMAVRVVAALAVLGGGLIHLKLYGDSYRHIDTSVRCSCSTASRRS